MKIPKVESHDFYFRVAYDSSKRLDLPLDTPTHVRQRESAKTFFNSLYNQLGAVIDHFPKVEKLSRFYSELIDAVLGIDNYKKHLGAVNWARFMVKKLYYMFRNKKISIGTFIGRSKSVLKQIAKDLEWLENARKELIQFPSIKSYPTVLLVGFPNVGKTSLLSKITGSEPEINSYPFTTKNLNVGVLQQGAKKVNIVDSPGLLEREFDKRNKIELKAIVALKYLADMVLFVYDSSGTSGFPVDVQKRLYNYILTIFPKEKVFTVTNKCELDRSLKTDFYVSCFTGEGIEELKSFILNHLFKS